MKSLQKKYRGLWYGARNNPITVKQLLDTIIKYNGEGFYIHIHYKFTSDNLLDEPEQILYLVDDEGNGRLRLDDERCEYLKQHLKTSYFQEKLSRGKNQKKLV